MMCVVLRLTLLLCALFFFFFFNDTATTEIYTLSLHDALPISLLFEPFETKSLVDALQRLLSNPEYRATLSLRGLQRASGFSWKRTARLTLQVYRSEEHTSELQSRSDLVCRLLLEKKKKHYIEE